VHIVAALEASLCAMVGGATFCSETTTSYTIKRAVLVDDKEDGVLSSYSLT
jgi:hypothetical protein